MCGRAKLPDDVSEIKLDLKIDFDQIGDYQPRWNAAPTSNLPVVVSEAGRRILTLMRWGPHPALGERPQNRIFDVQCAGRKPCNARRVPRRLASRTPLPRRRRRVLRVARRRQAAVRGGACQPRPNDAGRIMGRVAFAGGRDDQILRHRHHDRKCLAGASARSHAGCHRAGLLGRLAWGKLCAGEHS
jgi:SOS response associated peptidase (SRAP)